MTAPAMPPTLAAIADTQRVHLDVRDDIRRGDEPFAKIMTALKRLGPDQALVLRAPFEPLPLYAVLRKRGLAYWTQHHADDDWTVWCYRSASPTTPGGAPAPPARASTLDVRNLEPPLPMVRVLEAVDALAPGEQLEVVHDRRPMFLYPQLEERGFSHHTEEKEPGVIRIVIRRTGT